MDPTKNPCEHQERAMEEMEQEIVHLRHQLTECELRAEQHHMHAITLRDELTVAYEHLTIERENAVALERRLEQALGRPIYGDEQLP